MPHQRVVILGAGIQGVSLAFALASRGLHVQILDSQPKPLNATSVRNEGKIHLGFVYALDETGSTQRAMMENALRFSPLLDRWCRKLPWDKWRADNFYYAVMPESLAGIDQLSTSYERLHQLLKEQSSNGRREIEYLGQPLTWLWKRETDCSQALLAPGLNLQGLVRTQETAIDTRLLAQSLSERLLSHPRIDVRCGVRVDGAERRNGGFRLHLETPEGSELADADVVANCTWVDRTRIDETLGLPRDDRPVCYRIKHSIHVQPMPGASLVPITMVQGPFGDLVPRQNGLVYLSWYPECRTYFDQRPPTELIDDRQEATHVAERTLSVFQRFVPGLRGAKIVSSQSGVIVARGHTDIEDPGSSLHKRDQFGSTCHDGWWTVDTGKFTCAPGTADQTAEEIVRETA